MGTEKDSIDEEYIPKDIKDCTDQAKTMQVRLVFDDIVQRLEALQKPWHVIQRNHIWTVRW